MPNIKATEEQKCTAREIVEKSQEIVHKSLGISQCENMPSTAYTDFFMYNVSNFDISFFVAITLLVSPICNSLELSLLNKPNVSSINIALLNNDLY